MAFTMYQDISRLTYPILFKILHKLKLYASADIDCSEGPVRTCKEKGFYGPLMELLAQVESAILESTEYVPSSTMERIQSTKIKNILRSASRIPYWKERADPQSALFRGIRTMKEIEVLPVLTREDIQRHFPEKTIINQSIPRRRRVSVRTSGSTGQPLSFFSDTIEIGGRRARFRRMTRWLAKEKTPFVIRAKSTSQLGLLNFKGISAFVLNHHINIDISLSKLYLYLDHVLETSRAPVVVDTSPSCLMRLAEIFETSKLDISRVLGFLCSGEPLLPGEREYIKKKFPCKTFSHYTATEFGTIAQECGQSPQYALHVNAEYFYVEIVDDRGRSLPPGETGRIVITYLDQEIVPFLRYDTGDLGRILKERCPCGRTLPLLVVEGRKAHLIKLPDGRTFTQFSATSVFYNPEMAAQVRQFQIIREKPTEFMVKIVPNFSIAQGGELTAMVRGKLSKIFGEGVKISVETVKEIPKTDRGKRMGYVSKV